MTEELKKLQSHAQEIAERENCFLYDLHWVGQGQGRILRVFIDKEGEEGVSIDDCSRVSRGLDLVLDVEDLVPGGKYQLEVSSPGLDRHLSLPWHYEKAVGELATFNLNRALGDFIAGRPQSDKKRKKLTGLIQGCQEDSVEIILTEVKEEIEDKEQMKIPFEVIHKARVVFPFESSFNKKKVRKG